MAGGQIPLGIFTEYTDDDASLIGIVEQSVTRRLVEELQLAGGSDATPTSGGTPDT